MTGNTTACRRAVQLAGCILRQWAPAAVQAMQAPFFSQPRCCGTPQHSAEQERGARAWQAACAGCMPVALVNAAGAEMHDAADACTARCQLAFGPWSRRASMACSVLLQPVRRHIAGRTPTSCLPACLPVCMYACLTRGLVHIGGLLHRGSLQGLLLLAASLEVCRGDGARTWQVAGSSSLLGLLVPLPLLARGGALCGGVGGGGAAGAERRGLGVIPVGMHE